MHITKAVQVPMYIEGPATCMWIAKAQRNGALKLYAYRRSPALRGKPTLDGDRVQFAGHGRGELRGEIWRNLDGHVL